MVESIFRPVHAIFPPSHRNVQPRAQGRTVSIKRKQIKNETIEPCVYARKREQGEGKVHPGEKVDRRGATRGLPRRSPILVLLSPKHI